MRFERRGGPPDIEDVFRRFVVEILKGRALDDNFDREAASGKFPDFACFRDLVLLEMKHLESEQTDRVQAVITERVAPEERDFFYGTIDAEEIFRRASNGEAVKAEIFKKLRETIRNHLRKANAQFRSYRQRHPRKNSVAICVLVNSKIQEFMPHTVLSAVHGMMRKVSPEDHLKFPAIDAVLYISEKHHSTLPDGRQALAIGIFTSDSIEQHPWKEQFVNHLVERWSLARTGTIQTDVEFEAPIDFEVIDDIPERLPINEIWHLEYRRNRYLVDLPIEDLRILFNRCNVELALAFYKGDWEKPSRAQTTEQLRVYTHVLSEMNLRGVDVRHFTWRSMSPKERLMLFRPDLPVKLVEIFMRP